uniref:hydroxymethylglutaryl-CoA lyase n=1 Tax=Meloidogyne javanica TaxID=6303 RepID=A0A915MDK5_MELJA
MFRPYNKSSINKFLKFILSNSTFNRQISSFSSGPFRIVEVGPRDGLQNEKRQMVLTSTKIELINRLVECGLKTVEATSFVSPKWVPQFEDCNEVISACKKIRGVSYPVLVPNLEGLKNALKNGNVKEIAVFTAASNTFNRKNLNCSLKEGEKRLKEVTEEALITGLKVRGYISTVLGCPYEGHVDPILVTKMTERLLDYGCYEVSLGDTIGVGTAGSVANLLDELSIASIPFTKIAVHFHDTYGQALSNVLISIEKGIRVADSSIAGLGGCPFAKGATGNLATEDLVYMLEGCGFSTGVNLERLVETSDWICTEMGRENQSRVANAMLGKKKGRLMRRYEAWISENRRIEQEILRNYDKRHRPVKVESTIIRVQLFLTVNHIEKVDEHEGTMLLHGILWAAWNDDYLKWTPSEHNNTFVISMEAWKIWQPTFALYNSARSNSWFVYMSGVPATVSNDGRVFAAGAFSFQVTCQFNFAAYPYDIQECPIVLADWQYDASKVNLSEAVSARSGLNSLAKPAIRLSFDPLSENVKKHVAGWEIIDTWQRLCYWGPTGYCVDSSPIGPLDNYCSLMEFGIRIKRHAPYYGLTLLKNLSSILNRFQAKELVVLSFDPQTLGSNNEFPPLNPSIPLEDTSDLNQSPQQFIIEMDPIIIETDSSNSQLKLQQQPSTSAAQFEAVELEEIPQQQKTIENPLPSSTTTSKTLKRTSSSKKSLLSFGSGVFKSNKESKNEKRIDAPFSINLNFEGEKKIENCEEKDGEDDQQILINKEEKLEDAEERRKNILEEKKVENKGEEKSILEKELIM